MVHRQSVLLSVAICAVNVMVIVALLPDKKEGEPKPHTSDTVTLPNDELAGRTIQQPKPTLEFRRFIEEREHRSAEFCLWNRTDKEISIFAPEGYPEIHYRSNQVWFRDRRWLCGLGLTTRSIAPGKSILIRTQAESQILGLPPVEAGAVDISEWGRTVYTPDAMRVGLTYHGGSGATIWSDTIPLR